MHEPLILSMIDYNRSLSGLTQHLIKVHQFARLIGLGEGLDARTQFILEAAAIVHDVGIRDSLRIYGDDAGPHQEALGPKEAESLLRPLGYDEEAIARVMYLVGHHHTYDCIDGMDYRILVEADFLVNLYENSAGKDTVRRAYDAMFKTETGRKLCCSMFGL